MKKKIRINDKISQTIIVKEVNIPAKDHLLAQQKYKSSIQQDKTKIIPRKRKYKKVGEDD